MKLVYAMVINVQVTCGNQDQLTGDKGNCWLGEGKLSRKVSAE